jgi:hypothetical protein
MMNIVEVSTHGVIVGWGMVYFDGNELLRPDIVSLSGEILPEGMYNLRYTDEPILAVLAKTVQ